MQSVSLAGPLKTNQNQKKERIMKKATALECEVLNSLQRTLLKVSKKKNVAERVNDLGDIRLVLKYSLEQIEKIILLEISD